MPFDTAMTDEDIRRIAPSVFATHPAPGVSDKYTFIPTYQVLRQLRLNGLECFKVREGKKRAPEGREFAIHELRFRAPGYQSFADGTRELGMLIPEVILRSSHDRTSGFSLVAGVMRLICLNGATVEDTAFKIAVRHLGRSTAAVVDGANTVAQHGTAVIDKARAWSNILFDEPERVSFAERAVEARGSALKIDPRELLKPRRAFDAGSDLWTTFNVIQENLTRGGQPGQRADGHYVSVNRIRTLVADVSMNRKLWTAAEDFAAAHA